MSTDAPTAESPTNRATNSLRFQPTKSALVVVVMLLVGRLGGLVRDLIIAPLFGAGPAVDALVAARTVPELLLALVTGGAITAGFMPAFSYLSRGGNRLRPDGVMAISVVTNWLLLATLGFTLAGVLFPRALISVVTPGLDAAREGQAAVLLRIIMPVTVLVTMAAILAAWLNFQGRFALPSSRAAVTNVTIIVLTLLLADSLGIASVAVGWVAGAALQVVVLAPQARQTGGQYRWSLSPRAPHLGAVVRIIAPIVIAQFLLYGQTLVERQFGSWLPAGDLSHLNYAYRIGTAPMMIVTNAVVIVFLPIFSTLAAGHDLDGLGASARQSVRMMLLGIFPFIIVFGAWPHETISLVMQHGAFTRADTTATADLLTWYTVALIGASFTMLLSQVLYAQRRGTTALVTVAGGLVVQVVLTSWWAGRIGAAGVAAGTALGSLVSGLALLGLVVRSLPSTGDPGCVLREAKILVPAGTMLVVSLAIERAAAVFHMPVSTGGAFALSVGIGVLGYGFALWRLSLPEVAMLRRSLHRLLRRQEGS